MSHEQEEVEKASSYPGGGNWSHGQFDQVPGEQSGRAERGRDGISWGSRERLEILPTTAGGLRQPT